MWAMLRTSFTYDGFSHANGVHVAATVPLDLAAMLREWPGLAVTDREDHEQFGVCSITIEAATVGAGKPRPAPSLTDGRIPWNAVQLFILQRLGMDGWQPYAYGPNTSAGWPIHLLRKRVDVDLPFTAD